MIQTGDHDGAVRTRRGGRALDNAVVAPVRNHVVPECIDGNSSGPPELVETRTRNTGARDRAAGERSHGRTALNAVVACIGNDVEDAAVDSGSPGTVKLLGARTRSIDPTHGDAGRSR